MDRNRELLGYAAAFVVWLLKAPAVPLPVVRAIILFGSVAQGRAGPESDIDIFIDASSRLRQLRQAIRREQEEFELSAGALSFRAKGFSHELRIIVGNVEQWPDMAQSTAAGIVLYGRHAPTVPKGALQPHTLFIWEAKGPCRGAFLNKLYGYTVKGKRYDGAIQQLGGTKIGKGTALLPSAAGKEFMGILEKYTKSYKTKNIFL